MNKKPRLQYQRGWWYCWQPQLLATSMRIGWGKTPACAYNDWKARGGSA